MMMMNDDCGDDVKNDDDDDDNVNHTCYQWTFVKAFWYDDNDDGGGDGMSITPVISGLLLRPSGMLLLQGDQVQLLSFIHF